MTEEQKAFYLEHYRAEIDYCLNSIGKKAKDLNPEMGCCAGIGDAPVSYFRIALKYMSYNDPVKASSYYYKDWVESLANPNWHSFEDPLYALIFAYKQAGMYKETLPFYQKAYEKLMLRLKNETDITLIKNNFKKYKKYWPEEADDYLSLMRDWAKARELAKTVKPKPLDPAVQNNEWFHSSKQEEVLKALDYYYQNNVRFMLEKASGFKDPVIAAKAKEYLKKMDKDKGNEVETKKP
jgi:hypothetical protein